MDDFMLLLGLLLAGLSIWLLGCVFIMDRKIMGELALYFVGLFTGICFGLTVGIVISLAKTSGTGY